ncbi:Peroxidase [Parasponia andersonii]|uniref:Peroxidase n=1 Tax=Parasponia andersonii TaxID=3476 RepID=A0A2P5ARE8_PARAD|nr:Peroxidase [Parasponia andersonii]
MPSLGAIMGMFVLGLVMTSLAGQSYGELEYEYYKEKCSVIVEDQKTGFLSGLPSRLLPGLFSSPPRKELVDVEDIVAQEVKKAFIYDNSIVAALLRLQFHDCFVNGCDASILLEVKNSEKDAIPNKSVRGYELIDIIKARLEKTCPGVVSCADIIAMATRDAISIATPYTGNRFRVQTGRKDGLESIGTNALTELPPPTISMRDSINLFSRKGLTITDMVYLLGGHTVGVTHCGFIEDRLYNYNGTEKPDPNMNINLLQTLQSRCPQGLRSNNSIDLDQGTSSSFKVDNSYYNQLLSNKGILQVDQDLASSGQTSTTVEAIAKSSYEEFNKNFAEAIVKLQAVGVLVGTQGQIRSSCRAVNAYKPSV